jgi:DNA gyrase/topoisomerase IV subunit A
MPAKEVEKAEAQGLVEYFKLTSKINTSNMICFDFDNKIRKYASAEEIIEEFYPIRLAYYQKRKVSPIVAMTVAVSNGCLACRTSWQANSRTNSRS